MYGPVILLLCTRPGDDLIGAGAAILRAREQGSIISTYMLSTGLLPAPRWKFWSKSGSTEHVEELMTATRRTAVEYGHQFVGWNGNINAGGITPRLTQVAQDIERAFVSIKPDVVWAPAFLGLDPDYDAVNVIASRLPQLANHPLDIYEYIPRPIQRQSVAGSNRSHMVFPNRLGMELSVNLTTSESTRRINALDTLQRLTDEPLPTGSDRELFRLLPEHDYARPPYGYKNGVMLRGSLLGEATAKAVIPRFLQLQRQPVSRAVHISAGGMDAPLHHLPQG